MTIGQDLIQAFDRLALITCVMLALFLALGFLVGAWCNDRNNRKES